MDDAERDPAQAALGAMKCAHAPYSGFRVGAAVVMEDGRVFTGCNVESASYGLTLCAERSALAAAVAALGGAAVAAAGAVRAVHLRTEADAPTPPCGACRQWLVELARGARVVSVAGGGRSAG
ncbi:MAG: cytidine deaminase, partial [Planctomycetota bacterium]